MAQQSGYEYGGFSKKTAINDTIHLGLAVLDSLVGKQPTYLNVDQRTMQPGEAQTGTLVTQGQDQPKGGVSPLVVGAAAAGTLLVGIVLVKVLD